MPHDQTIYTDYFMISDSQPKNLALRLITTVKTERHPNSGALLPQKAPKCVWRPSSSRTREERYKFEPPIAKLYVPTSHTWFGVTPNHLCLSLWHFQTGKPCCRKETARCRSCSFRFKVRRQHSSFENQASELQTYRHKTEFNAKWRFKVIQSHVFEIFCRTLRALRFCMLFCAVYWVLTDTRN